jgi:hypothetical protein
MQFERTDRIRVKWPGLGTLGRGAWQAVERRHLTFVLR